MGIENENKIDLLNARISNLDIHINVLSNDILTNPDLDVIGKPTRQSVLEEFKSIKEALLIEKEALTNQG